MIFDDGTYFPEEKEVCFKFKGRGKEVRYNSKYTYIYHNKNLNHIKKGYIQVAGNGAQLYHDE